MTASLRPTDSRFVDILQRLRVDAPFTSARAVLVDGDRTKKYSRAD